MRFEASRRDFGVLDSIPNYIFHNYIIMIKIMKLTHISIVLCNKSNIIWAYQMMNLSIIRNELNDIVDFSHGYISRLPQFTYAILKL